MTKATTDAVDAVAEELSAWFVRIADLSGKAFGWQRRDHGEASALHVLRRQAARLVSSRFAKDGGSYTTLCLFLAAACRVLGLDLTSRHWLAAIRNITEQRDLRTDEDLGVALGSPAERFKLLLDDAIDATGLGPMDTVLDKKHRRLALGLAVNWGLRALLAYAAEAKLHRTSTDRGRHDLAWLNASIQRIRVPIQSEPKQRPRSRSG